MRKTRVSVRSTVLTAALAASALVVQAQQVAERVWVQFAPGQGAGAKAAVHQFGGEVHHQFDQLNAIVASVPAQAIQGLQHNPNVVLIEEDPIREMYGQTSPYGVDMVQAPQVWASSGAPTGAGVKVGVIDSGVYREHQDLADIPMSGWGLNSADDWDIDNCGHGTHVVGTIAAANNSEGVVGVAPSVSIFMVRVFGDDCGWAYSSTLVDAAYKCQQAGAKIISMSLGGSAKSSIEEAAFQDIYNKGVLCVAAAGNGGNTAISYPAGYYSVMSVAAVNSTGALGSFSQRNSDVEIAAPGVGVLSTVPFSASEVTSGSLVGSTYFPGPSYASEPIELAALGTATGQLIDGGLGNSPSSAWSGKIVLIKRGTISFGDKVKNVQQNGGLAVIIYNDVAGGFSGTLGSGSSTIPAVSITLEDGNALKALIQAGATYASVSTHAPQTGNGYAYYDGTSMATPHVAGVAALIAGAKNASASQIRAALRGSALDKGTKGRDTSYGFGIVQAKAALDYTGDLTAPVFTGLPKGTAGKGGSFTISWNTNEKSDSVVTFSSPGLSTFTDTALTTSHSVAFRGTRGATYKFTVSSSDAAGNMVVSTEGSVTAK